MDNADKVTLERVINEIHISFAKMTLEQIEEARQRGIGDLDAGMVEAIRRNAQALTGLALNGI
jgi:hypothetical protein